MARRIRKGGAPRNGERKREVWGTLSPRGGKLRGGNECLYNSHSS